MFRTRRCSNPRPQYSGRNCSKLGPSSETTFCAPDPCPINGSYTEWSLYGPCSQTCGTAFRQRIRKCANPAPKFGGKNCSRYGAATETKLCLYKFSCPRAGNYSKWSEFGPCTRTCGEGVMTRKRWCINPPPAPGGNNCTTLGPSIDIRMCNQTPCIVNGGYSQWSEFNQCDKSCGGGVMFRNRSCNNPTPNYGGRGCASFGSSIESGSCNTKPCPIHGGYSKWSAWTPCTKSCGGGGKLRTRTCNDPHPRYGGRNCSHLGRKFEFAECNVGYCPIDGGYTTWSEFSPCTHSCGTGSMKRYRSCINPRPAYNGRNCSWIGKSEEIRSCNTNVCPEYSQWSEFSNCSKSCAGGLRVRTRFCKTASADFGFVDCAPLGASTETRSCNIFPCPLHGGYTLWSTFTDCSASCGNGTRSRYRNCTNPVPKYGGKNCSSLGPDKEILLCNTHFCPRYSEWTGFISCSRSCGNGTQKRTRTCKTLSAAYGYINCSILGPSEEIRECNTQACPIHGGWSAWSAFSSCTKTCGAGTTYRRRNCTNPRPRYGGRNCSSSMGSYFEVYNCNTQPCPIDGGYGNWSRFEPCSRTCDGGRLVRRRYCTNPEPRYGGRSCKRLGSNTDSKPCNKQNCPGEYE